MKIAAWNVNSLKVRLGKVADWLQRQAPDVLCLQETKLEDHKFPVNELEDLGYEAAFIGQKTYNGVAILSRTGLQDVQTEFADLNQPDQRRVVAATVNGIRIVNVYVVNGQALDSDKFTFKMRWLDALHAYLQAELERYPELVLLGDFNIAPADIDIYNASAWGSGIHASPAERDKLNQLIALPLFDSFRMKNPTQKSFSWWDYRQAAFVRNLGLRIDLALISKSLHPRLQDAWIDQDERGLEQASDHAPIGLVLS